VSDDALDTLRWIVREESHRPNPLDDRNWRENWKGAWWIASYEWWRLRVKLQRWTGSFHKQELDEGNVVYTSLLRFWIMRYWILRGRHACELPKASVVKR